MSETTAEVVCSIAAGSSHTLAVLSSPESSVVLSWGRGEDGQLGHGDAEEQHRPRIIEALKGARPASVVCGAEYSLANCPGQKQLYSWGWCAAQLHSQPALLPAQEACLELNRQSGDFGRLGHGDCNDVFIPKPIASFSDRVVQHVACGDTHTIVVIEGGSLWSFGRNQNGQLGLGSHEDCLEPQEVTLLAHACVQGVACGAEHSLCVTSDGEAYAWGWGRYGNLGNGECRDEAVPTRMKGLDDVKLRKVACGWRHSMVVDDRGRLFTCGWSKYGQLGHGDTADRTVPMEVACLSNQPVKLVCGGWRHTVAVTEGSGMYAWGWNKFGQLGLGHGDDVRSPTRVAFFDGDSDSVQQLACGWRHTLAVTRAGAVFVWGRGTNGQLGNDSTKDVFLPMRLPGLSAGSINMKAFEHEQDGNEEMFVPASDRYALVPSSSAAAAIVVPEVPGCDEAIKRPRLE